MQFIIPVPVPKVWEWAEPFPFPFPNVQKSFPLTPALRTIKTMRRRKRMIAEWPLVPSDTNLGMTMLGSTLALESHTSDDCKRAFPLIAMQCNAM